MTFRYTPEVVHIIRARVAAGDFDWEICARLGCDAGTLDTICSQHGIEMRRGSPADATHIEIDDKSIRAFAREAAARGTSPQNLMRSCLQVIARDGLFAALFG